MNCDAMNLLFDNWKFADNYKAKIRSWIADVVNGNPITEFHNFPQLFIKQSNV